MALQLRRRSQRRGDHRQVALLEAVVKGPCGRPPAEPPPACRTAHGASSAAARKARCTTKLGGARSCWRPWTLPSMRGQVTSQGAGATTRTRQRGGFKGSPPCRHAAFWSRGLPPDLQSRGRLHRCLALVLYGPSHATCLWCCHAGLWATCREDSPSVQSGCASAVIVVGHPRGRAHWINAPHLHWTVGRAAAPAGRRVEGVRWQCHIWQCCSLCVCLWPCLV